MSQKITLRTFLGYWATNGIGFALDLVLVYVGSLYEIPIPILIPGCFIIAAILTYVLNYLFVFEPSDRSLASLSAVALSVSILRILWITFGVQVLQLYLASPLLSRFIIGLLDGTIAFFIDSFVTFRRKRVRL
jgi:putative flippase GtrA